MVAIIIEQEFNIMVNVTSSVVLMVNYSNIFGKDSAYGDLGFNFFGIGIILSVQRVFLSMWTLKMQQLQLKNMVY